MDKLRWREIDAVYDRVLEVEPNERAEALALACGDDEELRREVDKLLDHEEDHSIDGVLNASVIEGMIEQMIEDAALVKPGQRIKHYVIKSQIGRGGMGEIWQAENTHFDPPRKVAIKVLPPEFADDPERIRRFKREAETVARLNHSNIVTIYDTEHIAGDEGNVHFIVTELIEGQTLRAVMDEEELGWRKPVMIAAQVASALAAAHSVNIIHRDIKPENIMALDHDSNVPGKVLHIKVLDFGIAKFGLGDRETERQRDQEIEEHFSAPSTLPLSPSPTAFTVPGMLMGTPKYMSPEQARGEEPDARTDIFSFGIVLYEMIAGRHPYEGKSDEEILAELKSDNEIPPISGLKTDIPAAVDRLIAKAIRKRREDRYANVSEMQVDIEYLKSLIRFGVGKKEERKLRAQNADQLLTQYVVFHEAEPKTRIPLGALPGITRFASLKRGQLEQALIRKSFWRGTSRAIGLVLLVAAITTALAAYASVTESWKEEVLRDGHTAAVRRAVFSPDGTKLVSVGEDKQVIVWDFAKRERLATFTDHTDWVTTVEFSPDGK
ncbi:MAG: protein kinase [Blastocatellales bacterium]